jgi:hypothetical protein
MLKPSQLGVTNVKRTIAEHERIVRSKLEELSTQKGMRGLTATICIDIIDASNGDTIDIEGLKAPYDGQINNYFAEVMGPIWSSRGLIGGITKRSKCFFSASDTEALYDFIVYKSEKEPILVSNKQKSSSTNTLKPSNILAFIRDNKALLDKWGDTKYFTVFKLLNENTIVSGPINVITYVYFKEFTQSYPYITKTDLTKTISLLTGNNVIIDANDLPKNIVKLLKSDETTNMYFEQKKYKEATGVMINFIFEKFLSNMSKQDDQYNELFIDATNNNVLFLKFILKQKSVRDPKEKKMKKVGIVQFEIADPKTAEKKAFLRPKQGAGGRAQDKLGLQP